MIFYCYRNYFQENSRYLLVKPHLKTHISKLEIQILITTWNMNGQKPHNLRELNLFKNSLRTLDIIVIGTQESYTFRIQRWITLVQRIIGQTYILIKKKQLGKLHLVLFLHEKLKNISSVIKTEVVLFDKFSTFKSKGAISFTLKICDSHFLFTTVHFAPHQYNMKKRIMQMRKLLDTLKLRQSFSTNCKHKGKVLLK